MATRSRLLSKIAADIDANGNITANGIAADATFDSSDIVDLIDSDYVSARSGGGGGGGAGASSYTYSTIFGD